MFMRASINKHATGINHAKKTDNRVLLQYEDHLSRYGYTQYDDIVLNGIPSLARWNHNIETAPKIESLCS